MTNHSGPAKIVGLVLVRNEEFFLPWALSNIVDFCDEIIVLDNMSTDGTAAKLAAIVGRHPNIRVERIADANTSHDWVEPYANSRTWMFGVDGDEIYDPKGLAQLRAKIREGAFDRCWRIYGHVLHATVMDFDRSVASGYITPASHSITKLYNMMAMATWHEERRERFHGDAMVFHPGFGRDSVLKLFDEDDWDACAFRMLHLCFFRRSSIDDPRAFVRKNPREERASTLNRLFNRAKYFFAHPLAHGVGHKSYKYARGVVVELDIESFKRPASYAEVDANWADGESVLSRAPN